MTSTLTAFHGPDIFDGFQRRSGHALLLDGTQVKAVIPEADIPSHASTTRLEGGLLAPGFVDLQVNGGGGLLFNQSPTAGSIATITKAHLPFGTTSLLTTLITDSKEQVATAIDAARATIPGHIGLHLEGPHLSVARKGAHDPDLIRPMEEDDLATLLAAAKALPTLFTTVAPESTSPAQVKALVEAGAIVSIGHSDAQPDTLLPLIEAGASGTTHLFNAMSQIESRQPGLVGTALDDGRISASIIADGIHAAKATLRIALRAKQGPGKIFLITDAMATIGTDLKSFTLNGRTITRENGRLLLDDGTLAGADLDMVSAVRFVHQYLGVTLEEALRMASLYPAQLIKRDSEFGCLKPGTNADFIWLDEGLNINQVWQKGSPALPLGH